MLKSLTATYGSPLALKKKEKEHNKRKWSERDAARVFIRRPSRPFRRKDNEHFMQLTKS